MATSDEPCDVCYISSKVSESARKSFEQNPWFAQNGVDENMCHSCNFLRQRVELLKPHLDIEIDELLPISDATDAAWRIYEHIQARKMKDWPEEPHYNISLHQQAYCHIYDFHEGIPGEGVDGHLGNVAQHFFELLSSLKMAGFEEAFTLLQEGSRMDSETFEAALPLTRLIDFVRENKELF